VIDEKNKKTDVLFLETEKRKEYKQELTKLQAEPLKSKRLDGTF
jgi:hypothetical protein